MPEILNRLAGSLADRVMRRISSLVGAHGPLPVRHVPSPRPAPAPGADEVSAAVMRHAASLPADAPGRIGMAELILDACGSPLTPRERRSLGVMRAIAGAPGDRLADSLPADAELSAALVDAESVSRRLVDALRRGSVPDASRPAALAALGALASDAAMRAVDARCGRFPANWHASRSLAAALGMHDLAYAARSLTGGMAAMRMDEEGWDEHVMPTLACISRWAEGGFRSFPRVVPSVVRLPDGPGGPAWGHRESVLVLAGDISDGGVLASVDHGDRRGDAAWDVYHRGVPGYWELDARVGDARDAERDAVSRMVASSASWDGDRAALALADWEREVAPMLGWLGGDEAAAVVRRGGDVDAIDLL